MTCIFKMSEFYGMQSTIIPKYTLGIGSMIPHITKSEHTQVLQSALQNLGIQKIGPSTYGFHIPGILYFRSKTG